MNYRQFARCLIAMTSKVVQTPCLDLDNELSSGRAHRLRAQLNNPLHL